MLSGLIGVPLGSFLAQRLRRVYQECDPIICAWGLFISSPLVYVALFIARYSNGWCFFVIFLAEVALNLCWSIVADILLVSANNLCVEQKSESESIEKKCGKLTIASVHSKKKNGNDRVATASQLCIHRLTF